MDNRWLMLRSEQEKRKDNDEVEHKNYLICKFCLVSIIAPGTSVQALIAFLISVLSTEIVSFSFLNSEGIAASSVKTTASLLR